MRLAKIQLRRNVQFLDSAARMFPYVHITKTNVKNEKIDINNEILLIIIKFGKEISCKHVPRNYKCTAVL